jgi:hypothetical protein
MRGEKNEGATRVADQRAGGPYGPVTARHCGQHRCRWGWRWRVSRSVMATRRAAMVSAIAMPGTARDPLRSHSFTQCRSACS